jgi:hypothetical protein
VHPDPADGGGHPPGLETLARAAGRRGGALVEDPKDLTEEFPGCPSALAGDRSLQRNRIEPVIDGHTQLHH